MQSRETKECEAPESYKTVRTLPFTSHAPWIKYLDLSTSCASMVKTLPWLWGLGVDYGFLAGIHKSCVLACHIRNRHFGLPGMGDCHDFFHTGCKSSSQKASGVACLYYPLTKTFSACWELGLNLGPCGANPLLKLLPVDLAIVNFLLQSSTSRHLFTNVAKSLISIGPIVARSPPSNFTHF